MFLKYFMRIILVITSIMFVGCTGISPASLRPVTVKSAIELSSPFVYDVDNSISDSQVRYTLLNGKYNAWREDNNGTYYLGPPQCHSSMILKAGWAYTKESVGKVTATANCGIFVPKSVRRPAKIYIIIGSGKSATSSKSQSVNKAQTNHETPITLNTTSTATPAQAGVGAAIGGGVVSMMIAAEQGNIKFHPGQPPKGILRKTIMIQQR